MHRSYSVQKLGTAGSCLPARMSELGASADSSVTFFTHMSDALSLPRRNPSNPCPSFLRMIQLWIRCWSSTLMPSRLQFR